MTIKSCALWRWAGSIMLIWAAITSLVSPNPQAILGPAQQVYTQHPQLCVHTRLIDEVEEWVIQRSLAMVREMGATTIVEFFPWAYIERSPGQYDWQQTDRIIQHARNQGLQIIARMGMVPEWARPPESEIVTTQNYLPRSSFQYFADFTALFAQRYAGSIHHLIIWNEPNIAFEWGYQQVSPEDYVNLLRFVYPAVKEANPEMIVLAGALAPTLEAENSPNGMNDIRYLERLLLAGGADYFDALAVHTYGFTTPPDAAPDVNTLNFRRAELLFQLMDQYGYAAMPVYITETGWNDHPRWALSVSPSRRTAYTLQAIQHAEEMWSRVENICIWAFRYPLPTLSYPDNYTLVTTDFQAKPIYYALQSYALGKQGSAALWLPPPVE